MSCHHVKQRSLTFLAPGTGLVEDNFSTDGGGWRNGFRMIQVRYIYYAFYFYYYYIVIYNEIIIQLTIMLTGGGAQALLPHILLQLVWSAQAVRFSFKILQVIVIMCRHS